MSVLDFFHSLITTEYARVNKAGSHGEWTWCIYGIATLMPASAYPSTACLLAWIRTAVCLFRYHCVFTEAESPTVD